MTLLAYEDLRVTLPAMARPVLDGVGLTVAAGEVVALVGESGSGKSVTARAALGLFPQGAEIGGRVSVDGTDLVGAGPASLREVRTNKAAMIYQDPRAAINPVRRVGDFLTEPLRLVHGWSRARAEVRAAELLEAVGLPDPARHLNQFPHELSGGMLQRVVIAAALTAEPRLLLCDEPTTALDVSTQAEILAILGRLQRERGLGLLLITHDIELAASVSDRIYVMYAGRIVETAPVAELFASPGTPTPRDCWDPPRRSPAPSPASPPSPAPRWGCWNPSPGAPSHPAAGSPNPAAATSPRRNCNGTVRPRSPATASPNSPSRRAVEHRAQRPGAPPGERPAQDVPDRRDGGRRRRRAVVLPAHGRGARHRGESGSGKTTTARMLIGLERPDAGEILVQGEPLAASVRGRAARLARAKAVQIVFQDPYLSLDARIPVGATVDGVLRLHGMSDRTARAARVRELLAQVGLGDREAAALPRRLSGGQRQRAAIARALAVEPAVLVLDEAVSALDVSVQAQVLNLLSDIRRDTGIGLVFVSHDLAVVRYVCDEALVMYRGRTIEHRPVGELLTDPHHPYTRLLLASVPRPGWDPDSISRRRRELVL